MSTYERLQQQEQELRQLGQVLSNRLSTSEMQRIQAICNALTTERSRIRESMAPAWEKVCTASMEDSLPVTW